MRAGRGASKKLWLVRHGATDWSVAGRLNGWTDIPLNDLGRRQASALRSRLADRAFASVWSSDLRRSTETAYLAGFDAQPDERLRELNFGILEGSTWATLIPAMRDALIGFDRFAAPGGECVVALQARVREVIDALDPGRHLLFTHGGVIRLMLRRGGRDAHVGAGQVVIVNCAALLSQLPAVK